ncbi:MAG: hypothetical protein GY856_06685 [bacterium]|nr:hypothetical protein [bacterium]
MNTIRPLIAQSSRLVRSCCERPGHPLLLLLFPALLLAGISTAAEEVKSPGEPETNTLKWSTASEVDNFGFDVYRSESEDGPFTRLNADPVLGAGTTDEISHYEYVDDTIDPHKIYFYYVESISMGGVREKFTPTYEVPAKIKAAEEDETDDSAAQDSEG